MSCNAYYIENGLSDLTDLLADAPTLLLLNVITSNIRNCVRESSKVQALGPLRHIAKRLTADELIDRVVPYLVALFRDDSAQVRAASFEFLVEIASHQRQDFQTYS